MALCFRLQESPHVHYAASAHVTAMRIASYAMDSPLPDSSVTKRHGKTHTVGRDVSMLERREVNALQLCFDLPATGARSAMPSP